MLCHWAKSLLLHRENDTPKQEWSDSYKVNNNNNSFIIIITIFIIIIIILLYYYDSSVDSILNLFIAPVSHAYQLGSGLHVKERRPVQGIHLIK